MLHKNMVKSEKDYEDYMEWAKQNKCKECVVGLSCMRGDIYSQKGEIKIFFSDQDLYAYVLNFIAINYIYACTSLQGRSCHRKIRVFNDRIFPNADNSHNKQQHNDHIRTGDGILESSSEIRQNPWICGMEKFHRVLVFVIKLPSCCIFTHSLSSIPWRK